MAVQNIIIASNSDLLKLPEQLYGNIKKVGSLKKEPILYGDVNLLSNGELFYIDTIKQVYRYIKYYNGNYIFQYIRKPDLENVQSIQIPEEQLGTLLRLGYLLGKTIYGGDLNMVPDGGLYYNDNYPLISTVSYNDGTILLSTPDLLYSDNPQQAPTVVVTETDYDANQGNITPYVVEDLAFEWVEDTETYEEGQDITVRFNISNEGEAPHKNINIYNAVPKEGAKDEYDYTLIDTISKIDGGDTYKFNFTHTVTSAEAEIGTLPFIICYLDNYTGFTDTPIDTEMIISYTVEESVLDV